MGTYRGDDDSAGSGKVLKFVEVAGDTMTGDLAVPNLIVEGLVDSRDVFADGTKLDAFSSQISTIETKLDTIETGATGDQSAVEIKTAYESNADTNEFSDAEQTKLSGIEDNATADQIASEVTNTPAGNISATDVQAALNELDTEKASLAGDNTYAGTAQFAAGEGVVFNGDAIAAANTLDDYEEGTWTPVLSDGTNNANMSIQVGTYEKIGRKVFIKGRIVTSSLGSVSGPLRITGLPFTASSDVNSYSSIYAGHGGGFAIGAGNYVSGYVDLSSTLIVLRVWSVSAGTLSMTDVEWTADGELFFSAIYYT